MTNTNKTSLMDNYSENIVSESFIDVKKIDENIRIKRGLPKEGIVNITMTKNSAPISIFSIIDKSQELNSLKEALQLII